MALEVVWRNPVPPSCPESYLERLELDSEISICIVRSANARMVFEVINGGLDPSSVESSNAWEVHETCR